MINSDERKRILSDAFSKKVVFWGSENIDLRGKEV